MGVYLFFAGRACRPAETVTTQTYDQCASKVIATEYSCLEFFRPNAQAETHKPRSWFFNLICETKLADVAIALLTWGLILVGYFQAHWLQETVRVSNATAETQSNDTRILQRAYIAVEPLGIFKMRGQDTVIGHVGMKNAGRLPAREVAWFVRIKASSNPLDEEFSTEEPRGRIVIAPGAVAIRGSAGLGLQVPDLN